jgi:hypothetical protein
MVPRPANPLQRPSPLRRPTPLASTPIPTPSTTNVSNPQALQTGEKPFLGLPADLFSYFCDYSYKTAIERQADQKYLQSGFQIVPAANINEIALFKNDTLRVLVFAYRGTVMEKADGVADLAIAKGTFRGSQRWRFSLNHTYKYQAYFPSYRLIFTGHSLGGKIAEEMYLYFEQKDSVRCLGYVAFAPGSSPLESFQLQQSVGPDYEKQAFVVRGDPVPAAYRMRAAGRIRKVRMIAAHPHSLNNYTKTRLGALT